MSEQRVIVNGINALTGEYLVGPMTVADAAARARGNGPPKALRSWLKQLAKRLSGRFFGVRSDGSRLTARTTTAAMFRASFNTRKPQAWRMRGRWSTGPPATTTPSPRSSVRTH
jgi:hypothetical protein